jgi:hypothetical protein
VTADRVFIATTPGLRDFAERCRQLALVARHTAVQEQLLRLAREMEQEAGFLDRRDAAETRRAAS